MCKAATNNGNVQRRRHDNKESTLPWAPWTQKFLSIYNGGDGTKRMRNLTRAKSFLTLFNSVCKTEKKIWEQHVPYQMEHYQSYEL